MSHISNPLGAISHQSCLALATLICLAGAQVGKEKVRLHLVAVLAASEMALLLEPKTLTLSNPPFSLQDTTPPPPPQHTYIHTHTHTPHAMEKERGMGSQVGEEKVRLHLVAALQALKREAQLLDGPQRELLATMLRDHAVLLPGQVHPEIL